jgi:hypothetical protein
MIIVGHSIFNIHYSIFINGSMGAMANPERFV